MLIGNNTTYTNSAHTQRQARQLKQQQQQALMQQQQHQSPKVTNSNFNSYNSNNNNNNSNNSSPYPYHNTAPSTPIHNSSIPSISAQSPMQHAGSRSSVVGQNVSIGGGAGGGSGYNPNTTSSPSVTTPILRRNSNNNTSHPSSPSTSITTALGATTITASPFIHNKTSHYSSHNQNINVQNLQNSSPMPQHQQSFNSNSQNGGGQYTNGNQHPHNRKNSTTSLNSAQMLIAQLQQQNMPMQQQSHHQSNNQNLFNQPIFNNSPGQFNSNHMHQQQSVQQQVNPQYGSNDMFHPFTPLNKQQILQEIFNLNTTDINVYNKD